MNLLTLLTIISLFALSLTSPISTASTCGIITTYGSSGASTPLQGGEKCYSTSTEILSYKVDQGCTCAFFGSGKCSDKDGNLKRYVVGPEEKELGGARGFKCGAFA